LQVVYEASISIAQPDFTAEATAARSAGAEVAIVVSDFQTLLRVIQSANRQGWHPAYSGTQAFGVPIPPDVAPMVEGLTVYALTAEWGSPVLADYRAAVAKFVPGGRLGYNGPIVWAGGRLLERIAPTLGDTVTRDSLIKALQGVHNENLGGLVPTFSFNASGHPYTNYCTLPVTFSHGAWTRPLGDSAWACDHP
jgi:ABC-type branched-subunit amino acid transport system substrate-binding protein